MVKIGDIVTLDGKKVKVVVVEDTILLKDADYKTLSSGKSLGDAIENYRNGGNSSKICCNIPKMCL